MVYWSHNFFIAIPMLLRSFPRGQSRLSGMLIVSTALSSRYLCRRASRRAVGYVASSLACVAIIGYVTGEVIFQHADVPVSVTPNIAENHRNVDGGNPRQRLCKAV